MWKRGVKLVHSHLFIDREKTDNNDRDKSDNTYTYKLNKFEDNPYVISWPLPCNGHLMTCPVQIWHPVQIWRDTTINKNVDWIKYIYYNQQWFGKFDNGCGQGTIRTISCHLQNDLSE